MFIRVKTIKSHHYYYLVEDERMDGWHRQRVVGYLGNYLRALATLEEFQIPGPSRQRLRERIEQIEARSSGKEHVRSNHWWEVHPPLSSF
ncbi:MAG: hypothetical protein JO235_27255 [Chroococcidiopsidaceae cyanobacterium CP_BM_RX_35]|nr:hypothetical protein [Chroococcidiopsidaceae cyanobacterium CP_BM_RX_35]